MVICNITMGLGNQMFQYAAGRALSLTLNEPLKLAIGSYEKYPLRKYELEAFFEIEPQLATKEDIAAFNMHHPVRRAWNKLFPKNRLRSLPYEEKRHARLLYSLFYVFNKPHKRGVYEERQFHFDKNFFCTQHNVFLKGYWMSYKYFMAFEETIKKDFTIRAPLVSHLQQYAQEVSACNSIAVHIRCTDRKDAASLKLYGEIGADYFARAVAYIAGKKEDVHLYIFSDDIELAKKYVPAGYACTYVSKHVTKAAIEDMYLMSQCRNIAGTNSTFSWWAAYLNKHEDKIVVMPERWYNIAPYDYKDVYYPGWVKVKN